MSAPPAKWRDRAQMLYQHIGELSAKHRHLTEQRDAVGRQLEEALKAIASLEATAPLAAELEAECTPPPKEPEPPPPEPAADATEH